MSASNGAATCVAHIPAPSAITTRRCTERRAGAGCRGLRLAQLRVSGREAPAPHALKTTTNSRNILLVSYYRRAVRSRSPGSAADGGQPSRGHRKRAGHGPHRPDHHRRRAHGAHGARGAGYPAEAVGANASCRPGPGSDRIPRRDIMSTLTSREPKPPATPARHWQSSTITRQHCPAHPPQPRPRQERQQPVRPYRQALSRPVAPRWGSRQTAGRACAQIDRICTHNECTRHDSAVTPNGGSGVRLPRPVDSPPVEFCCGTESAYQSRGIRTLGGPFGRGRSGARW
jgi:hypothetical protein